MYLYCYYPYPACFAIVCTAYFCTALTTQLDCRFLVLCLIYLVYLVYSLERMSGIKYHER
jgi:hypothetical protein